MTIGFWTGGMRSAPPAHGSFASGEAAALAIAPALAPLEPVEVWLFGSRARGDHTDDSDFDLMVTLPGEPDDAAERAIRASLNALGIGFDLVLGDHAAFLAEAADPISFAARIRREGRLLYAAADRRPHLAPG